MHDLQQVWPGGGGRPSGRVVLEVRGTGACSRGTGACPASVLWDGCLSPVDPGKQARVPRRACGTDACPGWILRNRRLSCVGPVRQAPVPGGSCKSVGHSGWLSSFFPLCVLRALARGSPPRSLRLCEKPLVSRRRGERKAEKEDTQRSGFRRGRHKSRSRPCRRQGSAACRGVRVSLADRFGWPVAISRLPYFAGWPGLKKTQVFRPCLGWQVQ